LISKAINILYPFYHIIQTNDEPDLDKMQWGVLDGQAESEVVEGFDPLEGMGEVF